MKFLDFSRRAGKSHRYCSMLWSTVIAIVSHSHSHTRKKIWNERWYSTNMPNVYTFINLLSSFPWQLWNSLTFPGFPDEWSHCEQCHRSCQTVNYAKPYSRKYREFLPQKSTRSTDKRTNTAASFIRTNKKR